MGSGAEVPTPRFRLPKKKRSVLQSACDELIDKDRQIAGCVRPELDESFSDRGLVDPQSPLLPRPINHTYSARCRMAWVVLAQQLAARGNDWHDTGSTRARSVDEVALIRNTISHHAPARRMRRAPRKE
jgi:hypothetical protein